MRSAGRIEPQGTKGSFSPEIYRNSKGAVSVQQTESLPRSHSYVEWQEPGEYGTETYRNPQGAGLMQETESLPRSHLHVD